MRTTNLSVPIAFALAAAAACGRSSDSHGSTASSDDIATYLQLAEKVQSRATSYRTAMIAPGTATAADCQRVHDEYDAEMRPWVSQMVQMSRSMDRYMNDHGGASVADHACGSATMMYELDQHHAVACGLADVAADRAEATRHVDAVMAYGGHMWGRCDQMMRGADTGSWSWGPMMDGCGEWDGCCTGMMHGGCCGEMMRGTHNECCDW
jgi:hypothetical protein